ncbi:G-alpha-domain-containing protein [Thelephora ganbajun]|uniref:G-alpha-domain-containing protein n=1 Tax=Thelephora ganbajun TaxID=370292 RepID=A0ACB6ZIS5_THEGA|nr:G-alpha-domain-containing protein [Thelephora ganbajun]
MWPLLSPLNETKLEGATRIQEENIAAAKSQEIDLQIEKDKLEAQKKRRPVRILLLGQRGSGKSTILKSLQSRFAPIAFKEDSFAWCIVIHLNLVSTVNHILDLLPPTSPAQPHDGGGRSSRNGVDPDSRSTDEIERLRMQLRPLREVEIVLSKRPTTGKRPSRGPSSTTLGSDQPSFKSADVVIRFGSRWKAVSKLHGTGRRDQMHEMRQIIAACCPDIVSLWENDTVQSAISGHEEFQEHPTTFFLNNALRICQTGYEPTVDDILRTHLATLGVEEHHLALEGGQIEQQNQEWVIYDVSGSRTQRAAWVPYFDNVTIIMFVVPLSAFNQVLDEDIPMNGLFDSFQLWRTICNSKILAGVAFIVIFNKQDLLAKKIEAGIQFKDFVTSYKDKLNDAQSISQYLRRKFVGIYKEVSPVNRPLFSHVMCAIDGQAASSILIYIHEILLRGHLEETELM